MKDRILRKDAIIAASVEDVWTAWTTVEGTNTFFAPGSKIDLRPGGAYELYFDPALPHGQRGGEGCTLIAVEPPHRLSFTWSFPPSIPTLRNASAYTKVEVWLEPSGNKSTKVTLMATGWQEGVDWDRGYQYFDRAWSIVLDRLAERFRSGPIEWGKL